MIRRSAQSVRVHAAPDAAWGASFGILCAFEVLEHIEDDREALARWRTCLKPGGVQLLSVPAHVSLWTVGDEWAGHFRRYGRTALCRLLSDAGFSVERFECYGFPLTNLSERLSAPSYARRIHRNGGRVQHDRRRNNDRSGIDRGPHLKLYPLLRSFPGKLALRICLAVQHAFIRTDLGSGYLVKARRT